MERTKLLTFAVIGLFLLNLVTIGILFLKPNRLPHPEGLRGSEEPATILIERLHFDSNQQQAYRQLVRQHQEQTGVLNEQMAQLYRDYYGLLAMSPPDSIQAASLSQQIADNQRAQAQLNFDHFKQIKALCRSDQQAYFSRLLADLAKLFGQHQRPPQPHDSPEGHPQNFPSRP